VHCGGDGIPINGLLNTLSIESARPSVGLTTLIWANGEDGVHGVEGDERSVDADTPADDLLILILTV